jgi:hypothetical protein
MNAIFMVALSVPGLMMRISGRSRLDPDQIRPARVESACMSCGGRSIMVALNLPERTGREKRRDGS